MKILFIGPQGCGKGTQAEILHHKLGIPHISVGDLLRSAKGKLREKIDSYIVNGNLLPDEFAFEILKKRLNKKDCKKGFILDGFPRNLRQAEILDELVKIDKVFYISISDEESLKRLSARVACKICGKNYNKANLKPRKENVCDNCGGELVQRDDDKQNGAIRRRLEIYHKETKPIVTRYEIIKINGEQSIEKVGEDIALQLK